MHRILSRIIPVALTAALLAACGSSTAPSATTGAQAQPAATATTLQATQAGTAAGSATAATPAVSAATAAAEKEAARPAATETTAQTGNATRITLDGSAITVDGKGASVDGSRVTITAAGTYEFSGALTDGQVVVDTGDEETVTLILNGIAISNSTGAPLYIADAEDVTIVLAGGSEPRWTARPTSPRARTRTSPNAALFGKADLTIGGGGAGRRRALQRWHRVEGRPDHHRRHDYRRGRR